MMCPEISQSETRSPDSPSDFDQIIYQYYQSIERNDPIVVQDWLDRYPDHAQALNEFFSSVSMVHQLQDPVGIIPRERLVPGREDYIGEYRILSEIARGGMGLVLAAYDEKLKRRFAIKLVLHGTLAGKVDRQRLEREARSVAGLNHPNIVRVHHLGTHQGMPYLVMDLVEGVSLSEQLKQGSLSPRTAATLVRQLALAVDYAHSQGVIHRDLKPGNVLIDDLGEPHLVDFGLAKSREEPTLSCSQSLTQAGQILGTPGYMSPEQASAQHHRVTQLSDVYSLGAMLYACLCGRAPFVGESTLETLQQVKSQQPPSIRLLNVRTPRDLETIVHKCLRKDPQARYANAKELADDLERYLENRPILARRINVVERVWRWQKQNRAVFVLGTTTIATMLICLLWVGLMARQLQIELRNSLAAETRAQLRSGSMGQQFQSLVALKRAAKIEPSASLRSLAITALALPDLQQVHQWDAFPATTDCFAWDPQGKLYARGTEDGAIHLHRIDSHDLVATLESTGHSTGEVIKFSPDGSMIAVGYAGLGIWIWRIDDQKPVLKIADPDYEFAYEFSPDSQRFAMGNKQGQVSMWDIESQQRLFAIPPTGLARYLSFSPDGKRLAVSRLTQHSVDIITIPDGIVATTLKLAGPFSPRGTDWHPDGKHLVVGAGQDVGIRIWNVDTGTVELEIDLGAVIDTVAFHPSGDWILSNGWDGYLRLWDFHSGQQMLQLPGQIPFQFSPDGHQLVTRSGGSQVATYQFSVGPALDPLFGGVFGGVAFPRHDELVAFADSGARWSSIDGSQPVTITSNNVAHAVHRDDDHLLLAQPGNGLTTVSRQSNPEGFEANLTMADPGIITTAYSAETDLIAIGRRNGSGLLIWPDRPGIAFGPHPGLQFSELSPNGKWLATGPWRSASGVCVWDTNTGELQKRFPFPAQSCRAWFSPDGKTLAIGCPSAYHFYQSDSWEPIGSIPRGPAATLFGRLAYSQQGDLLALNHSRHEIRLYQASSLKLIASLPYVDQRVHGFSPDGSFLVVSLYRNGKEVLARWDIHEIRSRLREVGLDWTLPP